MFPPDSLLSIGHDRAQFHCQSRRREGSKGLDWRREYLPLITLYLEGNVKNGNECSPDRTGLSTSVSIELKKFTAQVSLCEDSLWK